MAARSRSPADIRGGVHTRRWVEQRWLIDNMIRSVGVDWDQPRTMSYNAPCGPEANADFAAIRERVKKYADIAPAFESVARRREAKARAAEGEFDEFRKTLTWEGHTGKIRVPYLCVAGEADELSPLEHTERVFATPTCPKQLVAYQDSRHSVGNVPSTNLGPHPQGLVADWMKARLDGKPLASQRWYVEASGRVVRTPF